MKIFDIFRGGLFFPGGVEPSSWKKNKLVLLLEKYLKSDIVKSYKVESYKVKSKRKKDYMIAFWKKYEDKKW